VPLAPKRAAALWCLARRAGQLVTREHVFATEWAGTVVNDEVQTRIYGTACDADGKAALRRTQHTTSWQSQPPVPVRSSQKCSRT
jgi:hypothetical protein